MYSRKYEVAWDDLDANGHMANTAFLRYAHQTRCAYFSQAGFPMARFAEEGFGPIVLKDEVDYYKELMLLQPFSVDLELAGLSEDDSRMVLVNRLSREDGRTVARIKTVGAWFSRSRRKIFSPPAEIRAALHSLHRTDDYETL